MKFGVPDWDKYDNPGPGRGYADDVELVRLGEAAHPVVKNLIQLAPRAILEEDGFAQQPDEVME